MSTFYSLARPFLLVTFSLAAFASAAAPLKALKPGAGTLCTADGRMQRNGTPDLLVGRTRLRLQGEPVAATDVANIAAFTVIVSAEVPASAKGSKRMQPMEFRIQMRRKPGRSSLVSFPSTQIWWGEHGTGALRLMVLATLPASGQPRLLAAVAVNAAQVHVSTNLSSTETPADEVHRLSALEHLYTYLHYQEPLLRYVDAPQVDAAGAVAGSQAAALVQVVAERQCLAVQLAARGEAVRRWEWASLMPVKTSGDDVLMVAALARDSAGRPVQGASLAFARGTHFACDAKTDAQGVARCRMFDVHGHGDDDDHGHETKPQPTVVSFGGVDQGDSALLPRTLVVNAVKGVKRPHQ
jgi:hypothetical protein